MAGIHHRRLPAVAAATLSAISFLPGLTTSSPINPKVAGESFQHVEVYQPIGIPSEDQVMRISSNLHTFGSPPEIIYWEDISSSSSSSSFSTESTSTPTTEATNITEISGFSVSPQEEFFAPEEEEEEEEEEEDLLFPYEDSHSSSGSSSRNSNPLQEQKQDQKEEKENSKRGIMGHDDRRLAPNPTQYPFTTIGKLQWSNGVFCTATLVGPRHVTTAAHCTPKDDNNNMSPEEISQISLLFHPGFDLHPRNSGGRFSSSSSRVKTIIRPRNSGHISPPQCDWRHDWAVLVLDKPLGRERGWMGVRAPLGKEEGMRKGKLLHTQGYPGDRDGGMRPYRQDHRRIVDGVGGGGRMEGRTSCDGYGPLLTDIDAAGGQSGSPVWGVDNNGEGTGGQRQRWVYGMLSVTSNDFTAASGGLDWVDAVIDARRRFPG